MLLIYLPCVPHYTLHIGINLVQLYFFLHIHFYFQIDTPHLPPGAYKLWIGISYDSDEIEDENDDLSEDSQKPGNEDDDNNNENNNVDNDMNEQSEDKDAKKKIGKRKSTNKFNHQRNKKYNTIERQRALEFFRSTIRLRNRE